MIFSDEEYKVCSCLFLLGFMYMDVLGCERVNMSRE